MEQALQQIPLKRYALVMATLAWPQHIQTVSSTYALRLGESDDCSGAVSFLCSDDALYITGETIVIAGGTQSRL